MGHQRPPSLPNIRHTARVRIAFRLRHQKLAQLEQTKLEAWCAARVTLLYLIMLHIARGRTRNTSTSSCCLLLQSPFLCKCISSWHKRLGEQMVTKGDSATDLLEELTYVLEGKPGLLQMRVSVWATGIACDMPSSLLMSSVFRPHAFSTRAPVMSNSCFEGSSVVPAAAFRLGSSLSGCLRLGLGPLHHCLQVTAAARQAGWSRCASCLAAVPPAGREVDAPTRLPVCQHRSRCQGVRRIYCRQLTLLHSSAAARMCYLEAFRWLSDLNAKQPGQHLQDLNTGTWPASSLFMVREALT